MKHLRRQVTYGNYLASEGVNAMAQDRLAMFMLCALFLTPVKNTCIVDVQICGVWFMFESLGKAQNAVFEL